MTFQKTLEKQTRALTGLFFACNAILHNFLCQFQVVSGNLRSNAAVK